MPLFRPSTDTHFLSLGFWVGLHWRRLPDGGHRAHGAHASQRGDRELDVGAHRAVAAAEWDVRHLDGVHGRQAVRDRAWKPDNEEPYRKLRPLGAPPCWFLASQKWIVDAMSIRYRQISRYLMSNRPGYVPKIYELESIRCRNDYFRCRFSENIELFSYKDNISTRAMSNRCRIDKSFLIA